MAHTVGLISDTHGLLRPEAVAALGRPELIIHAGDVGKPEVLTQLGEIAPVVAVRGNVDRGDWAAALPETEVISLSARNVYVLHDVNTLDLDPAAAGISVVVSGHSHQPRIAERDGVLYVNPGSAGPRRFKLPVAVAKLVIRERGVRARILELQV